MSNFSKEKGIALIAGFQKRGVDYMSLQDGIDTATSTGRFTFNIFASLAEFEREIIKERTKAGLVLNQQQISGISVAM